MFGVLLTLLLAAFVGEIVLFITAAFSTKPEAGSVMGWLLVAMLVTGLGIGFCMEIVLL